MTGTPPVAIVGMAVLLPGAPDLATYRRNLELGFDAITNVPAHRWDPWFFTGIGQEGGVPVDRVYCRRGGFVDGLAAVPVTRYGIPPTAVEGTEPDQLIALHVAAQALDDAGGRDRLPDPERIGVILGRGGYVTPAAIRFSERVRGSNQLVQTLREMLPELPQDALDEIRHAYHRALGAYSPENAIGLVSNLAASRLANRLDLRGPAYTVDGACASSLLAVDQAVSLLHAGRCDLVLAGGVHHCHDISFWSVFSQMRALSANQQIRPYDRRADGTLIGEGTGIVVLKRLDDAERDGDRVYAVIRGVGVGSDGRSTSLMNPDPTGQARAVRQAWRATGLDPTAPHAVGMVEGHGTATAAGDLAEIRTMLDVFGAEGTPIVLGSVKSMIGHTMPAAGVAGLVKAALAVYHGVLPPTLHCEEPHPALAGTRFEPIGRPRPWPEPEGGSAPVLRRAAVNAFGFGGINAHVVLEQAPAVTAAAQPSAAPALQVRGPLTEDVLRLAADDVGDLAAALTGAQDRAALQAVAVPEGRGGGGRARLVVADPTPARLAMAREVVAGGRPWRGRNGIWFTPHGLLHGTAGGRVAFVFPGLDVDFEPRLEDVSAWLGLPPPATSRQDSKRHGLSVLRVGALLDRALRAAGVVPDAVMGSSVGEWSALLSGGALPASTEDLLDAVDLDTVDLPDLAFAAVALGASQVEAELRQDEGIVVSHDNSPQRCVVCGPPLAVRGVLERLSARGVLGRELPFRSGFHTPMFAPFTGPFRQFIDGVEVAVPSLPIWSATTARAEGPDADVRAIFLRHLVEPVRLRQTLEAMYAAGFRVFVQVGLGQLPMMTEETLGDRHVLAVEAASPVRDGMTQLRRAVAALWSEGLSLALPGARAAGPPARTAARTPAPAVALDLGTAMVSFAPQDRRAMRTALDRALAGRLDGAPTTTAVGTGAALPVLPEELAGVPGDRPVAAEYRALVAQLAETTHLVATAARGPRPAATVAPAPTAPPPTVPSGARAVLHVGTDVMPYLLDHCFVRQRPGWPDEADRRPVVPATTIVHHMLGAVQAADPSRVVAELADLRLLRWLVAAPAVDVPVVVEPAPSGPDGAWLVTFGDYSGAAVRTAPGYPAPPERWRPDAAERRPPDSARRMYERRLMFHGPAYQGVTELTAMGERDMRGVITTPVAPGALLDCAGQILGYWIIKTFTTRTRVLPVHLDLMRLYGPFPEPGTQVECHVRVARIDDDSVEADIQLCYDGRVWAELQGWRNRRFDNHPETQAVENFPEYRALSREQPGGWVALFERWGDLASRDLVMHNHLGAAERAEFEACPPRGRRHWLLGRISVKDAVRTEIWRDGLVPVFPAEVRVLDGAGGPVVHGLHGRSLPPVTVAAAQCRELGVALVRLAGEPGPTPRIAVVEVPEDGAAPPAASADPAAQLPDAASAVLPTSALRAAAFQVARDVAAVPAPKLAGCRVDGGTVVLVLSPDGPGGPGPAVEVAVRPIRNPDDLPSRQYLVGWTPERRP
ncbi:beta-ketoacyl synthase N-terminal-like domain-containing protein [Microbispora sp. NPDC049125]|uniref:beta-ketoacyl synthase N-terminal-like domain-containing protein n=1 Tax=Microbispora sp. NPDC049125 TaxID=3154929 RepID=UPI00346730F8